ncbi:hypothetical protein GCM10011450_24100 [Advenella faeciporci]|uniref:Lipoprotein n=1 Tax=Advenella faeciporci TaxID=797535 RepID=A0A918JNQ9_9BURK|nr:hypothetical protein [Advenella faeciporci]GGW93284.1 hypothetical protein GCM10011450_24100 [Advenella faeciporci]
MKRKLLTLTMVGVAVVLSGCDTMNQNGGSLGSLNFLSTDGEKKTINTTPIKIKVPDDAGILRKNSNTIVGDLIIPNLSVTHIPNASYSRVFVENKTDKDFVVHARNDNGIAGSGIKYNISYEMLPGKGNAYQVVLTPNFKTEYQQGLIGKFPLPNFTEEAMREYLRAFSLIYKFEVDSKYNSESTMANFMRMATVQPNTRGMADPVTGKIFNQYFETEYQGKAAGYFVEVFPYRDGSKAVIYMELPTVETSSNEVDFEIIIKDLKSEMDRIVNS